MKYRLVCSKCGSVAEKEPAYKCKKCGGILTFSYDFKPGDYHSEEQKRGIFRFSSVLPVREKDSWISLGEGNTPLVPSVRLGPRLGLDGLFFKLENMNPSASFKDRASVVSMSCALRFGSRRMIIASSGNASASAAAYAARCGMELVAAVPGATPANKVAQAATHGAKVVKIPGVFSDSYRYCREMAEEHGWFDLTTTFVNPYAREGYKTIGYELYEQFGRGAPDWILVPTGDGPLLAAVYQAFEELESMGGIRHIPKLVCVQAANCGPIAKAFLEGAERVLVCGRPQPTLASGINDSLNGYADDGDFTLDCIRKSGGTAVLLSEEEIGASVRMLAEEGIYAEPAGAVSAAALRKLNGMGIFGKSDRIVGLVTGHGLKNPLEIRGEEPSAVLSAEEPAPAVETGCADADQMV